MRREKKQICGTARKVYCDGGGSDLYAVGLCGNGAGKEKYPAFGGGSCDGE